jgi:hypothetical protein
MSGPGKPLPLRGRGGSTTVGARIAAGLAAQSGPPVVAAGFLEGWVRDAIDTADAARAALERGEAGRAWEFLEGLRTRAMQQATEAPSQRQGAAYGESRQMPRFAPKLSEGERP